MPWIANVSQAAAESHVPQPGTVCISITKDGEAKLRNGYDAILRLNFGDIDPIRHTPMPEAGKVFSKRDAERIERFAKKWAGRNFLVHCHAGISRSGAVANALIAHWKAEGIHQYEDRGWDRFPNTHVLTVLKRQLGLVPFGQIEV